MREAVFPASVAPPGNPYSPAVKAGGLIFISGQVAKDPATKMISGVTIEEQARMALGNLQRVAAAAGTTLDQVVKVTVFLRQEEDFAGFNRVFAEFFAPPYPARSTLVAPPVGSELLVEVEAVALSTTPAATP